MITIQSYDNARLAIVQTCERQAVIEAIAAQLRRAARDGLSLQRMYGSRGMSQKFTRHQ